MAVQRRLGNVGATPFHGTSGPCRADNRDTRRLVYIVPDKEVVSASVEGRPIDVYPGWRFMFVGLRAEGIEFELTLRGMRTPRLTVLDQTDGLPAALSTGFGAEPEDTMPAILPRWARGYPTFVSKTYVFD